MEIALSESTQSYFSKLFVLYILWFCFSLYIRQSSHIIARATQLAVTKCSVCNAMIKEANNFYEENK